MKQIFRIIGGIIFLILALAIPVATCFQKMTDYREKEAIVTKVESHQTKGRRGRVSTKYNLRYTYEVNGIQYDGFDRYYLADSDAKPGDPVRILYKLDQPGNSRIAENGGQNWTQTLFFTAAAGYLFFSFYRNRR